MIAFLKKLKPSTTTVNSTLWAGIAALLSAMVTYSVGKFHGVQQATESFAAIEVQNTKNWLKLFSDMDAKRRQIENRYAAIAEKQDEEFDRIAAELERLGDLDCPINDRVLAEIYNAAIRAANATSEAR